MKTLMTLTFVLAAATAFAADWPREINSQQGMITIYEPQISAFDGNTMNARAAISITPAGQTEPIFGAVWMDCRIMTDRPTRTVKIQELKVKQIRFPNRPEDETAAISASLEQEIPQWDLTFSLDELTESLETAQKEKENAHDIDVTPPKIIVMQRPAVLILIDGEPVLTDVEGTNLQRVANTPYFIVQDVNSGMFYLRGGTSGIPRGNSNAPGRSRIRRRLTLWRFRNNRNRMMPRIRARRRMLPRLQGGRYRKSS